MQNNLKIHIFRQRCLRRPLINIPFDDLINVNFKINIYSELLAVRRAAIFSHLSHCTLNYEKRRNKFGRGRKKFFYT